MRSLLTALTAIGFLNGSVVANEAREPVKAEKPNPDLQWAKNPTQHVVILTPRGPVVAELRIFLNGEPFRMVREKLVTELMDIVRPPGKRKALTWVNALGRSSFAMAGYRGSVSNLQLRKRYAARFDTNGNNWVEREEVRKYVDTLGYGNVFNIRPAYNGRYQPDIKKVLDANGDGKLSMLEIKSAPQRLKSRDADDNDLLLPNEIGGYVRPNGYIYRGRQPVRGNTDVFELGENANLSNLFTVIKTKYRGKSPFIRKSAFQIAPELFDQLDLNKNQRLDSGEVVAMHLAKPQLKIEIHLGESKGGIGIRVTQKSKGFSVEPANQKSRSESVTIVMPGWRLQLNASKGRGFTYDYSRTVQSYMRTYDADKNGYLDEKDIKKLGQQGRYLQSQMASWDLDADGKAYPKEIKKSFERNYAPQNAQVSLSSLAQPPSLFGALDETGDNRLSLREMKTAADRLLKLDANKNGRLDAEEMPSGLAVTLYQGRYNYVQQRIRRPGGNNSTIRRGPKWFYHMDKNGDGDITVREFLGTKTQFAKIDSNSDGFIEAAEASAAKK